MQVVVAGLNRVATADDRGRCELRGLLAGRHHLGAVLIGYTLVDTSASLNVIRGQLVHALTLRTDNVRDEAYLDATSRIESFARNSGRNLALVYRVLS